MVWVVWEFFIYVNHQNQQHIIQHRNQLSSLSQNLLQLVQQTEKLRPHYKLHENKLPIKRPHLFEVLNLLNELPLQEGELSQIIFSIQSLQLKGYVEDQNEFEMIHHFLNQHTLFEKIELIQFKPTKDQIYFEFDLKIDTREKINEQKNME